MAIASNTRTVDLGLTDRIAIYFKDLAFSANQFRLYKKTYNELSDLTDRDLADLGLTRASLRSVAHEAVYSR